MHVDIRHHDTHESLIFGQGYNAYEIVDVYNSIDSPEDYYLVEYSETENSEDGAPLILEVINLDEWVMNYEHNMEDNQ